MNKSEFKRCEICEIYLDFKPKFKVVDDKITDIIIGKSEALCCSNEINPNRCNDCLNFEERIKDYCGLCRADMYNSPKMYIMSGNVCRKCISTINEKLKN